MKATKINPKYYTGLSKTDTSKQIAYIKKSQREYKKGIYRVRPTPKSYKHKPSRHIVDLQRRYGLATMNTNKISNLFGVSASKQKAVLAKGMAAYYSSGSRPGQTPSSWAHARLASVLLGRGACKIDQHIILPVRCSQLRAKAKSHSK